MKIKHHQHISLKPPYCLRVFISLCYFYVLPVRQWSEPIPFSKWYLCPQSISLIRLIMLFEFVSAPLCPKSFLCPPVFCFPKKVSHCRSYFMWFANYPDNRVANKMIKNNYYDNYACCFIVFSNCDSYYYDNKIILHHYNNYPHKHYHFPPVQAQMTIDIFFPRPKSLLTIIKTVFHAFLFQNLRTPAEGTWMPRSLC